MNVHNGRQTSLFTQLHDQAHDLPRGFGVERSRRFINEQQFRILDESTANADALALAAGKFIGAFIDHVIETDAFEQPECFIDVRLRIFAKPAAPETDVAETARQDVLHHRQPFDQRVLLEDHAHTAARLAQLRLIERGQFGIVQRDRAGCRLNQSVDAADNCRFARTRGADQRHNLTVRHFQIDTLQRQITSRITLCQASKFQHWAAPKLPGQEWSNRPARTWSGAGRQDHCITCKRKTRRSPCRSCE